VKETNYPALSFFILWSASMFAGVYWYERAIKAEKSKERPQLIAIGYGQTPEAAIAYAKDEKTRLILYPYSEGYVLPSGARCTALIPLQ